ncbi:MAG: anthranilate synthase component I, partial [Gammaproteobacteria bacterium]|nr:anthranilate synthase component I [Gammaproteobacteria bacterium]
MDQTQFDQLAAEGYNRIPLTHTILADMDTPLSAYRKVAEGAWSYLFESVQGGEKWGRYSIIGLPAETILRVRGHQITVEQAGQEIEAVEHADPLSWIESYQQRFNVAQCEGLPRFTGGLVGCFGYDTIRLIEGRLSDVPEFDPLNNPDIVLMVSEEVLVFDNLSGKLHIVIHVDPRQESALAQGQQRLAQIKAKLEQPAPIQPPGIHRTVRESDFVSGFTQERFEQAVEQIKKYIVEGDVMQVVISQRLSIPFQSPPLNLYRALRTLNPSPYMFYLNLGDFQVVGSSPEILTRVEEGVVTVRPIAGTRRRGHSEEEDLALEEELLADPKERAEHLMLIDLGRNDVGRVAETGSVELTEKMRIERYSHVMHIVSNVTGKLKAGMSAMDALRATFPAGTVSGAPKIRAMEIIDELEPVKRGIYAGAVGYIG